MNTLKRLLKWFLYLFYTRRLERRVRSGPTPNHIALILDGNRRYARKMGLSSLRASYELGFQKVLEVLEWCDELRIPVVTLWVLSTENLRRRPDDLVDLFQVLCDSLPELTGNKNGSAIQRRIQVLGRPDLLPQDVHAALQQAQSATADRNEYFLNIAVAYGGRQEIVDAVRNLLREKEREGKGLAAAAAGLTAEEIARHTYTAQLPDPDLIVRTSGELRLSGFLLWQSAYSEYYFCDAYWPEFRKIDLLRAVRSFQSRWRRFGE